MLTEIIGILVVLYSIWFYIENYCNGYEKIPGPTKFPPFGNLVQIFYANKIAHIALAKLAKKYGDVMNIKMGLMDTIIFSSYDAARQVFTKDETSKHDTTGFLYDRVLQQNIGLAYSSGEPWAQTRAFCRNSLRNYGYGSRDAMQNLLLDELVELFGCLEEDFKSNPEGRVHIHSEYFQRSLLNIMLTLIMGKRHDYDDSDFQYLLQINGDIVRNGALGAGIMMAYPFLRYIFPEALGYNTQMKGVQGFSLTGKKFLAQRKALGKYKEHPTCLTDDFLNKMEEESNNPTSIYTGDHYAVLIADLIQAGIDTAGTVINFILLHLTVNPNIQEKVYKEISDVIGTIQTPDLQHKLLMPYTQAVILEGLRWSRVVVMGIPRKVLEDFTYRSYNIKKGTTIMYNLQTIFFDEDFWGDSEIFRPERFLDKEGSIDTKMMEIIMIIFGAGPRICFGEVLARDSIFIYITSLIQKFQFKLPPGSNPSLEPLVGLTLCPEAYDAIVRLRN